MGKLQKKQEALAEQSSDIHDLAPPEYTSTVPSSFPDDDDDDDDDAQNGAAAWGDERWTPRRGRAGG
ncbi:hypothetical protein MY10362_005580 [Beauveria mimosiformis]